MGKSFGVKTYGFSEVFVCSDYKIPKNHIERNALLLSSDLRIIKMNLTQGLFWDTDFQAIDYQKYSRKVIERVLTMGTLSDWFEIKNYYGLEKIKNEALQMRYLDEETLNFCCEFYNLQKEDFRCYTFQQLGHTQHWQF